MDVAHSQPDTVDNTKITNGVHPDSEEEENEEEGGGDQGKEFATTVEVLNRLRELWLNEKFSPELLPYAGDVVDCMVDQINYMEKSIQTNAKPTDSFRIIVHKSELERIRFMLHSYLRIRLQKVEKYGAHLLKQDNVDHIMSPEEKKFAENHVLSIERYLYNVAIQHMPSNMRSLDLAAAGPKPNLDSFVFLRVKRSALGVPMGDDPMQQRDDDDAVDLQQGTQHIMRYRAIAPLVQQGDVVLM